MQDARVKPLHLLGIVSFPLFPARMGGQKFVSDYYAALESKGLQLTVCASREERVADLPPTTATSQWIPCIYHHREGWKNIFLLSKLIGLVRKHAVDLVLIDHSYLGWMGWLIRIFTGKPFVIKSANLEFVRLRENGLGARAARAYRLYEQWIHRKADFSFFISAQDQSYAIRAFGVDPQKTALLPFSIPLTQSPTIQMRTAARERLCATYGLDADTVLFYFNGTLDYLPNKAGLHTIVAVLVPKLQQAGIPYCIFISGNRIEPDMESLLIRTNGIRFLGYLTDYAELHLGTDCFICPLESASGVKTKIAEALAYGQIVISMEKAAGGFDQNQLRDQLRLIKDGHWDEFAAAMLEIQPLQPGAQPAVPAAPASFYEFHNQDRIVSESLLSLQHACSSD